MDTPLAEMTPYDLVDAARSEAGRLRDGQLDPVRAAALLEELACLIDGWLSNDE